jgi:hypothetical protein
VLVRKGSAALAVDLAPKAALVGLLVWLIEYVTFTRHSPELKTTYHDTLGDLTLGPTGSVLAGAAVARFGRGDSLAQRERSSRGE